MRRILASLIFLVLSVGPALARSEKTLSYPREHVWPTAVRFLVVDEQAKILDKDADTGYLVFELTEEKKKYRGSLEVLTITVDGRTEVRFVLQIPDRPSWVEIAMLTRLERKVRSEHGSPTPPRTKDKEPPKDAPKDAAKDAAKDAPKDKDTSKPREEGGVRISPTP